MKKRLLFFACLGMLFSLGAKAQNVSYTPNTTWANAAARSTLAEANGIKIDQIGTQASQPAVDGPFYVELNNSNGSLAVNSTGNDAILITATTATNIKRITLTYRANNATNVAIPYLGYGSTSEGTYTGCLVQTSGNPAGGEVTFNYDIPVNDAKYVIIVRAAIACTNTSNTNTPRIAYIGVYDQTTLPLDLLSFSARPDGLGKSVNLNWKTTNEVNTQDFVIERRTDDTEFAAVGTVLSKNVAGTHNYSFSDQKPIAGNSYYRLKQRDKDGKFTYSEIANVKIEGISLSLHPNPVLNELVVNHEYAKKPSVLKVLSLNGASLIKTNTSVGTTSTAINVASLASGSYLLVQETNGKPQSQKFIKK